MCLIHKCRLTSRLSTHSSDCSSPDSTQFRSAVTADSAASFVGWLVATVRGLPNPLYTQNSLKCQSGRAAGLRLQGRNFMRGNEDRKSKKRFSRRPLRRCEDAADFHFIPPSRPTAPTIA